MSFYEWLDHANVDPTPSQSTDLPMRMMPLNMIYGAPMMPPYLSHGVMPGHVSSAAAHSALPPTQSSFPPPPQAGMAFGNHGPQGAFGQQQVFPSSVVYPPAAYAQAPFPPRPSFPPPQQVQVSPMPTTQSSTPSVALLSAPPSRAPAVKRQADETDSDERCNPDDKRTRNKRAAEKYRKKKKDEQLHMNSIMASLQHENEALKLRLAQLEAELQKAREALQGRDSH